MIKKVLLLSLVFITLHSQNIFGQTLSPNIPNVAGIRKQLANRGIAEKDFVAKLKQKGIVLESIDGEDPDQVIIAESAIRAVIAELEADGDKGDGDKADGDKNVKKPNGQNGKNGQIQKDSIKRDTAMMQNEEPQKEEKPRKFTDKEKTDALKETAKKATTKEISKAVKEGATVEEAVTEKISESIKDQLPPATTWGQEIFRDKSISTFRQSQDVKPPDSYILGAGDQVAISIWGYSQENLMFELNKDGYIKPEAMPRINLKGIPLGKARELLKSRFSTYYRFKPEEFEVSIYFARTITVHIVGEVYNFGSFSLPAMNTAFNALAFAGGPTNIGSVRNIKLKRGGRTTDQSIDIYEFLLNPSAQDKLYLEENDYIYVPPSEKLVTISGAVNRPNRYELKGNESLKEIIKFAAGLRENAMTENCVIKRYVNDIEQVMNVSVKNVLAGTETIELKNGDNIIIEAISKPYDNFLNIEGTVDFPGEYAVDKNFKLSELLQKARLNNESRRDTAYVVRTSKDNIVRYLKVNLTSVLSNPNSSENIELLPEDRVIIFSKKNINTLKNVQIKGEVKAPGFYPFSEDLKVRDLLFLANGLTLEATEFAYIERFNLKNPKEKQYIRINAEEITRDANHKDNIKLQPLDIVNTFSSLIYSNTSDVKISGAVNKPGIFQYAKGLTINDILVLSGGFKEEASPKKVDVYRVLIQENEPTKTVATTVSFDRNLNVISGDPNTQLQPYDIIAVRTVPDFQLQSMVTLEGEVTYPGDYALTSKNETIASVIARAGGLTKEGFPSGTKIKRMKDEVGAVIIRLDEALKNANSNNNIVLKDGDIITIPKTKDLITIYTTGTKSREVNVQADSVVNVPFYAGKNAKFYIDQYTGGLYSDKKVKWKDVYVESPNGKILKSRNFIIFKTFPKVDIGSSIKVGLEQKEEEQKERKKKDPEVLEKTIQKTTMLASLITLIIGMVNAIKPVK
jgi:protein involved in polysaccharide export with SLBB domain